MESPPKRSICTKWVPWTPCSTWWARSRGSSASGSRRSTTSQSRSGAGGWRPRMAVLRCRPRRRRSCSKGLRSRPAGPSGGERRRRPRRGPAGGLRGGGRPAGGGGRGGGAGGAPVPRRRVAGQLAPEVGGRVKVIERPDAGGVGVKPESEDGLAAAEALGGPPLEVARAAQRDAEALVSKSKE